MTRLSTVLACVLAMAFIASSPSLGADKKKKTKKDKGAKEDPPPAAAEEMTWLQQGHASYIIRDYGKALDLYRKAGEKMPKSPVVHYFIGCALKAKGENEKAIESFRTSYLMATGKEEGMKGVALVQVALLSEAMGDLEEAKNAWQDYLEFYSGKGTGPDLTALASKRIEAIYKVIKLKKQYEPVKKLIVEQKDKEKAASGS